MPIAQKLIPFSSESVGFGLDGTMHPYQTMESVSVVANVTEIESSNLPSFIQE